MPDLRTFLICESVFKGISDAMRARRFSTSKRERATHLQSVVNFLDTLDRVLGR